PSEKSRGSVPIPSKPRADRNRSLSLSDEERAFYGARLLRLDGPASAEEVLGRTIRQDLFEAAPLLPGEFVDLLVVDPPYNLSKDFNGRKFRRTSDEAYEEWV